MKLHRYFNGKEVDSESIKLHCAQQQRPTQRIYLAMVWSGC